MKLSFLASQRASDAAFALCHYFPDRLTVDQRIGMEVICLVAPERLDAERCGEALALYSAVVSHRA